MNISIFGLGYVGCVGMGCLASKGHMMVGVDVAEDKVSRVASAHPTIIEPGLDALMEKNRTRISATADFRDAVCRTDVSFICVGTPSGADGHLDLSYILQTAAQIGEALSHKTDFHVVVIRSTVFPGTNARIAGIIESKSGKRRNEDFAVVSNPEFLREGTAVKDYLNPPLTVLGSDCPRAIETMRELYMDIPAPLEIVPVGVAEMIKYVNNSYHALKVSFANEVGAVCKSLGVDSHALMRIFCMDRELNISPYYFKPGFAYGGSCLPKDLLGLKTLAADLGARTPVIDSIDESNRATIARLTGFLQDNPARRIGILGLSFKADTDDMRNSPIITVIESLREKDVRIYDRNVSLSCLTGRNKSDLSRRLPSVAEMLIPSLEELVGWAEILVVANKDAEFRTVTPRPGQMIVDLVRLKELESLPGYYGFSW